MSRVQLIEDKTPETPEELFNRKRAMLMEMDKAIQEYSQDLQTAIVLAGNFLPDTELLNFGFEGDTIKVNAIVGDTVIRTRLSKSQVIVALHELRKD